MKFRFLPMMVLAAIPFLGNAQRNCGTMDHHQHLLQQDPAMQSRMDQIEVQTRDFERQRRNDKVTGIVYTIPVVVHVVYNGSTQNISDAQVLSQIDVLNKDFRLLNPDNVNVPSIFASLKSDVEINFCMAQRDPNGQPTNGITRTATTVTSFGTNNSVKSSASGGKDAWNTSQYLNMWVCNIGGGILGYAQFPGGAASTDGVVMDYRYFGLSGSANAPFNLGRTATHEVGHWLNLRHIWGDATCGSDQVTDTPTHNAANYGCPGAGHLSTCTGTPVEMWMNYMDYSDDACMYMFSAGQTTRMRALFATGGARASLLSSLGCTPPSTVCGTPSGLNATSITNTSATLNWTAVSGASSYSIQYRPSTATTFTTVSSATNSFNLTGLTLGTGYVYQVSATCSGGSSSYSSQASFTTTGGTVSCGTPTTLTTSGVTSTGATLNWAAVTGASSYNIQYKTSAATTYTTTTSTTNSVALTGLTAATTYVFNVQAVCSGTSGAFSSQGSFTTSSATITYCTSRGNSVVDEWIDRVSLNNLLRTSGADAGYIYSTTTTANVTAGTSYALGYSAGFRSGYTATQYWRVWIDYNKNGLFTDAGEQVVSRSSSSASNLSTTIKIPTTAKNGITRMRVSMKWNSAQTSSCETFSYGEVEDYNVNISGGVNRETSEGIAEEEVVASDLQIFPNPASDRLIIQRSSTAWMQGATLMVVDMQGKVWTREALMHQEGVSSLELNTSGLPNGLYNLVIFTGSERVTKKVVVMHP